MRKYVQAAVCAAIISVCLLGCGNQELDKPTQTPDDKESTAAVSTTETVEDATVGESSASRTQHVTQDLAENLTIDAEAVIPGRTQYSTYTLKMVDSAPDQLFGIFCPEGYGSFTKEDRSYPGSSVFAYKTSDGKVLVVQDNCIDYSSYDVETGNQPMQEIATLMYYHTQEHPDAQPHDLSFMTVAEMEGFCKTILTQLGVAWEPKLNQCVTLSGQEILDFQQEMFGKSYYTEMGQPPMQLTDAKDSCYLEFSFSFDGIPLFGPEEPTVSFMDGVIPPSAVKATIMINADGIQDFHLQGICAVAYASDPQTVLTLEDAITALKNKYDVEILFGTQKITDIWMEYIPVKQGESTVLTPYWCFKNIDESGKYASADRINAITGKDLAYGG